MRVDPRNKLLSIINEVGGAQFVHKIMDKNE